MKYHFSIIILVLLLLTKIIAQSPQGIVSIPKIYLPGDTISGTSSPLDRNEFGFEIWLVNSDSIPYAYNAAQYGIDVNPMITIENTLTAEMISSQLISTNKQPKVPEFFPTPDRIRLAANKFGNGGPFIQPGDSINIAVVKVRSSKDLSNFNCNILTDLKLREKNPDAVAVFIYADENMKANTGKAVMLNISRITYNGCKK